MSTEAFIYMLDLNVSWQPICGYGCPDALPFRQTREGELFFVDDLDIDLANIGCSNHVPHELGTTTVKGEPSTYNSMQMLRP